MVEREADILAAHNDIDFVYPDYYEQFPDGSWEIVRTGDDIIKTVKVGMMHRADYHRRFNLYDPEMIFAEYDLLQQYLNAGLTGYHISDPLFVYHRRRESQTGNRARVKAGKEELKTSMARTLKYVDNTSENKAEHQHCSSSNISKKLITTYHSDLPDQ
ncbi:hypothetical protein [Haladaptatus halobius]|uniref:hypothetical protein n=1 Tax=Haladaptatus halobius TaxID=2884875 RepID=UPI003F5F7C85